MHHVNATASRRAWFRTGVRLVANRSISSQIALSVAYAASCRGADRLYGIHDTAVCAASYDNKLKPYELFARHVVPEIKDLNRSGIALHNRIDPSPEAFAAQQRKAMDAQFEKLKNTQGSAA